MVSTDAAILWDMVFAAAFDVKEWLLVSVSQYFLVFWLFLEDTTTHAVGSLTNLLKKFAIYIVVPLFTLFSSLLQFHITIFTFLVAIAMFYSTNTFAISNCLADTFINADVIFSISSIFFIFFFLLWPFIVIPSNKNIVGEYIVRCWSSFIIHCPCMSILVKIIRNHAFFLIVSILSICVDRIRQI